MELAGLDVGIVGAGLLGGLTVGTTGMGGGALMTPLLVLVFGVDPLTAVSTDVVASLVMKPIGGSVHLRRGTVHRGIVRCLALGSVPAAFAGVLFIRAVGGEGEGLEHALERLLGVTLVTAAAAMTARVLVQARRPAKPLPVDRVAVRPWPTLLVGVGGGLMVGMTSVGSGSLIIVLLLWLYPALEPAALVGTDLVQAVPLVGSASLGHLLFGDLRMGLTGTLLLGSIPGVYVGARISSRAPAQVIRPLLVTVLVASAAKLLDAPTLVAVLAGVCTGATALGAHRWASRPAVDGPLHASPP